MRVQVELRGFLALPTLGRLAFAGNFFPFVAVDHLEFPFHEGRETCAQQVECLANPFPVAYCHDCSFPSLQQRGKSCLLKMPVAGRAPP